MKKYTAGFVLFIFSFGWLLSAQSYTLRYRGGSFDRYRELLSQYKYTSPARQRASSTPKSYAPIQRSSRTTNSPLRQFSERSYRNTRSVPMISDTRQNVPLQAYFADHYSFSLQLPEGFVKSNDTLTGTDGEMIFRDGNILIRIRATDQRCNTSYSLVEKCLINRSEALAKKLTDRIDIEIRNREMVTLENNNFEFDRKTNIGRMVEFFNRDLHIVQLTFTEPLSKNVWHLEIQAPNKSQNLAANQQLRYDIFNSLLQDVNNQSITSRKVYLPVQNEKNTPEYLPRYNTGNNRVNPFDFQTYKAEQIPFQLQLPYGFQKTEDSLTWNKGTMKLENGEETIAIIATMKICKDQTRRVVRRCIEDYSEKRMQEYRQTLPSHIVLEDQNREVRLTREDESYGHYFLAKVVDNGRVAQFIFPEPLDGYVWEVYIQTHDERESLLNDNRKLRKLLTSLFFATEKTY